MADLKCPKCDGAMEEGFLLDNSYTGFEAALWLEGRPEGGFLPGVRTQGKRRYRITAYRCVECGYLEFYARTQPDRRP